MAAAPIAHERYLDALLLRVLAHGERVVLRGLGRSAVGGAWRPRFYYLVLTDRRYLTVRTDARLTWCGWTARPAERGIDAFELAEIRRLVPAGAGLLRRRSASALVTVQLLSGREVAMRIRRRERGFAEQGELHRRLGPELVQRLAL